MTAARHPRPQRQRRWQHHLLLPPVHEAASGREDGNYFWTVMIELVLPKLTQSRRNLGICFRYFMYTTVHLATTKEYYHDWNGVAIGTERNMTQHITTKKANHCNSLERFCARGKYRSFNTTIIIIIILLQHNYCNVARNGIRCSSTVEKKRKLECLDAITHDRDRK